MSTFNTRATARNRKYQQGFSLVELLVSASLVGLVVIPYLLTASTMVTKTITDSYSHTRTSQELNGTFREMNRVFEGASMLGEASATPATELRLSYYNPNTGTTEPIGYRLVQNGSTWNLVKLMGSNYTTQVSPYATLKSNEVAIGTTSGQPSFDYCKMVNGVPSCTNTPSLLTKAYLESVDFVRLNATAFNVVNAGLTAEKSKLTLPASGGTPGMYLFMGKKFSQETGNSSSQQAVLKSLAGLTALFGPAVSDLNLTTVSLEPRTGDSTILNNKLISDELSGEAIALPQGTSATTVPSNAKIQRAVADPSRNAFGFIATDTSNNNPYVYFFNADAKTVKRVSAAGTVAKSSILGNDFPLAFDSTSGNLFWVSNSNLMAYKPATDEVVTVGALATTVSGRQVSVIPDNSRGVVFVVMDNGLDGGSANTKIQMFNSQQLGNAVYTTDLNAIALDHADAGVTVADFDYANAWVVNNDGGELNLLVKGAGGLPRIVLIKPTRSGTTVSVSNRVGFYNNTAGTTVHMDKYYADQLTEVRPATSAYTYFTTKSTSNYSVTSARGDYTSSRALANNASNMAPSATTGTNTYTNTSLTTLAPCYTSTRSATEGMTYQPTQLSSWFSNNFYYGPTMTMFYSLCDQEGSLWLNQGTDTAYWGGNGEQKLHRAVQSPWGSHTLSEFSLQYDDNGTPRTLNHIGVDRAIGATADNSAIVFGAEYSGGAGKATMIHHFASGETTSLPNDRKAWVMPIPNSQKILFTYKDVSANRQVLGAYDACSKTVTTSPFFVKDNFADSMKDDQILAIDEGGFNLVVNDYDNKIQFWNFGNSSTKAGRDGNYTANTAGLTRTDSRYIKVSALGANVLEQERIVATTQSETEAFVLTKAAASGCATSPTPKLARFKCLPNNKDSKSSANLCRFESEMALPTGGSNPTFNAPLTTRSNLAISAAPGSTEAYILDGGTIYTIANRNDTAALGSYTASFSVSGTATSFVKSRKTGNFYVLNTDGAVAGTGSTEGLRVEGYNPNGTRNTSLDFILPLDASSVGASNAFNPANYTSARNSTRMQFDETRGYVVLYSTVSGKQNAYTYDAPSGHPM